MTLKVAHRIKETKSHLGKHQRSVLQLVWKFTRMGMIGLQKQNLMRIDHKSGTPHKRDKPGNKINEK
jgi:hypothetical protein